MSATTDQNRKTDCIGTLITGRYVLKQQVKENQQEFFKYQTQSGFSFASVVVPRNTAVSWGIEISLFLDWVKHT
jgi:hypothetical protein